MVARVSSEDDISRMRTAGGLAASVLDMIGEHVQPGVTTEALNQRCHDYIVDELGCVPAPLNYSNAPGQPAFPRSICTSVNHVVCHGIPSDKKTLKSGDIVNIDITVIKDGFHGDTSKMFMVGKPSVLAERLVRVTQECLYRGIEAVRAGARHGLGRQFHDEPQVLHYGRANTGITLEEGMTFTVEPMINAGKRHVKILPDHWTVVTKDHKLSAQWEHTLLVTATGAEVLTRRSEEPFG